MSLQCQYFKADIIISSRRSIPVGKYQSRLGTGPSAATRIPQVKTLHYIGSTYTYMCGVYGRVTVAVMKEQIGKLKEQLVKERHMRYCSRESDATLSLHSSLGIMIYFRYRYLLVYG